MSVASPPLNQILAEIDAGQGLSLQALAKLVPAYRGDGTANKATVWRWVTTGTRRPDGTVVRLEAVRLGSRWLSTRAALLRYVSACTGEGAAHAG